jgi:hypothetical protein
MFPAATSLTTLSKSDETETYALLQLIEVMGSRKIGRSVIIYEP